MRHKAYVSTAHSMIHTGLETSTGHRIACHYCCYYYLLFVPLLPASTATLAIPLMIPGSSYASPQYRTSRSACIGRYHTVYVDTGHPVAIA
eukprot:2643002-Rhodomonas_salina.1